MSDKIEIKELERADIPGLLELYTHLHEETVPAQGERLDGISDRILSDKNYHIMIAVADGRVVSSCTCIVVPNFTHGLRPYALVENVVTHSGYRKRGLAAACLGKALEIAKKENCYKIMLLTGSKKREVHDFYRKCGYSSEDKTGYVMWLE